MWVMIAHPRFELHVLATHEALQNGNAKIQMPLPQYILPDIAIDIVRQDEPFSPLSPHSSFLPQQFLF